MNKTIVCVLTEEEARCVRNACHAVLRDGPQDKNEEDMLWKVISEISVKLRN
jgi:hypothetical protein